MRTLPQAATHDASVSERRTAAAGTDGTGFAEETCRECGWIRSARRRAPRASCVARFCREPGTPGKKNGAGNHPAPYTQHQSFPDGRTRTSLLVGTSCPFSLLRTPGGVGSSMTPAIRDRVVLAGTYSKCRANPGRHRPMGVSRPASCYKSCRSFPLLKYFHGAQRTYPHPGRGTYRTVVPGVRLVRWPRAAGAAHPAKERSMTRFRQPAAAGRRRLSRRAPSGGNR